MSAPRQLPSGRPGGSSRRSVRGREPVEGLALLVAIVVLMWVLEAINSLDSGGLDGGGIYPRNVDHLWGIVTAPFLHASFTHLIDNTVPFVFMGVIIAIRGAARLALVTIIVIVAGGLGTWLIAPSDSVTVGASGVVFGYATYLFTRGIFNRHVIEVLVGIVVGVVWGGALLSSLVPHYGISWQAHVCGGVAGVLAAWLLARPREQGTTRAEADPLTRALHMAEHPGGAQASRGGSVASDPR